MAKHEGWRERIFNEYYDTCVGDLPERLLFFRRFEAIGNEELTNMLLPGALPSDRTAVFYGARVTLMGEHFDSALAHDLQMSALSFVIGAKNAGSWGLSAVPHVDSKHGRLQATYVASFGEDPPPEFEEQWRKKLGQGLPQNKWEKLFDEYEQRRAAFRPFLCARQGFEVSLIPASTRFRDAWRALPGHKALRVTVRVIETRDVQ